MESRLNLCLAVFLGRDAQVVVTLLAELIWHAPISKRINVFASALEETGLDAEYPFVVPVLERVFKLRNQFAHSIVVHETAHTAQLWSAYRGKFQESTIDAETVDAILFHAAACDVEFDRIESRIGDLETWGTLYGFDT